MAFFKCSGGGTVDKDFLVLSAIYKDRTTENTLSINRDDADFLIVTNFVLGGTATNGKVVNGLNTGRFFGVIHKVGDTLLLPNALYLNDSGNGDKLGEATSNSTVTWTSKSTVQMSRQTSAAILCVFFCKYT